MRGISKGLDLMGLSPITGSMKEALKDVLLVWLVSLHVTISHFSK